MKSIIIALLLAALLGCERQPELSLSNLTIQEIEQLSFDDAYSLWQRETTRIMDVPQGHAISIPSGTTHPQTRVFTPSQLAALECRLGREAHLHTSFLADQLKGDMNVHRILEASPRLCAEHGFSSKAQVEWVAEGQYRHRTTDGYSPQIQQGLWLQALSKSAAQISSWGPQIPGVTDLAPPPADSRR